MWASAPPNNWPWPLATWLPCAVRRSRVKRLLRESYRRHRAELAPRTALILVGRKAAVAAKCQEVERAYLALCRKAGILR